jgi:predicted enzyme related to lactoylglutathione lyase
MAQITLDSDTTLAMSVRDRHAACKWYADMFGFDLIMHVDDAGWSEMKTKTPGLTLGFSEMTDPAPGNTVPVFGVVDFDASRTALEAQGVKFDGDTIEVEGMVKTATFYDPDGNALMIAQDLTKHP